ncbi:MAG: hypothetical protein JO362_01490 [Streptomycetaceae bacterium]|nr:hypothetical protein [Streptomycetaceae bacterium]
MSWIIGIVGVIVGVVNNAAARVAGLLAMAVLSCCGRLATDDRLVGGDYRVSVQAENSFRVAMVICEAVLAVGSALA